MSYPKAYEPQEGYRYQILLKTPYDRAYVHCEYALDREEKDYLIGEYKRAYGGANYTFKAIPLPKKYWPKEVTV